MDQSRPGEYITLLLHSRDVSIVSCRWWWDCYCCYLSTFDVNNYLCHTMAPFVSDRQQIELVSSSGTEWSCYRQRTISMSRFIHSLHHSIWHHLILCHGRNSSPIAETWRMPYLFTTNGCYMDALTYSYNYGTVISFHPDGCTSHHWRWVRITEDNWTSRMVVYRQRWLHIIKMLHITQTYCISFWSLQLTNTTPMAWRKPNL